MTERAAGFDIRILTGWISEYVNRPLPGAWPQIPLDDETLADFDAYFDLCVGCGYSDVVVWGFFVDRRWPLDVASCLNDDRRDRIQRLVGAAHARNLKIHGGLGIYSWGFDGIIEANPGVSRTNPRAMCPSAPEAWEWMQRVIDVSLGEVEYDGVNMQSADQGRCECDDCKELTTLAYHARLNERVADYIRSRWPGKFLIVDNWGCPYDDPDDLPDLVSLSSNVDCIFDHSNSSAGAGTDYRRRLAESLECPFGTLAGHSVWPPQRWEPDRYFLTTTMSNVEYIRGLHADGASAAEQFVTSLANPSGEITLRFMGRLLSDVSVDPDDALLAAVGETYEPADSATADALVEMVKDTEAAYFASSGREYESGTGLFRVGLFNVDGGLMPNEDPSPATYLRDMELEGRNAYVLAIGQVAQEFEKIRAGIGRSHIADITTRCFANMIADAAPFGSS